MARGYSKLKDAVNFLFVWHSAKNHVLFPQNQSILLPSPLWE